MDIPAVLWEGTPFLGPLKCKRFLVKLCVYSEKVQFLESSIHPTLDILIVTNTSLMYSGPRLPAHWCTRAILSSILLSVNGAHFRVTLRSELAVQGGLDNIKRIQ